MIRAIYFHRNGKEYKADCFVQRRQIVRAELYELVRVEADCRWVLTIETWEATE